MVGEECDAVGFKFYCLNFGYAEVHCGTKLLKKSNSHIFALWPSILRTQVEMSFSLLGRW